MAIAFDKENLDAAVTAVMSIASNAGVTRTWLSNNERPTPLNGVDLTSRAEVRDFIKVKVGQLFGYGFDVTHRAIHKQMIYRSVAVVFEPAMGGSAAETIGGGEVTDIASFWHFLGGGDM